MRIRKKEWATLLTIVVTGAALIFAGCSHDPSPESPKTYTVTVKSAENGSITAEPKSNVAEGASVTLTISPASGYRLKKDSLSVKRSSGATVPVYGSGDTYAFSMPASDVTVSGEFELPTGKSYKITIDSGIENGSITANPSSAQEGITVTLTISPDPDYRLKSISVKQSGAPLWLRGSGNTRAFSMPASDVAVFGEFELIPKKYHVTVDQNIQHGNITPNLTNPLMGTIVTLTISPDPNYQLKSLSVKQGGTPVLVSSFSDDYRFTMPSSDVTVSGEFELIPENDTYAIKILGGIQGGTITANRIRAEAGTTVTLTITPHNNYRTESVSIMSMEYFREVASDISGNTVTFTMPPYDVSVSMKFTREYAIRIAPAANGSVTADLSKAISDQKVTLTINPDANYRLKSLNVTSVLYYGYKAWLSDSGDTRFFYMLNTDVMVTAEFEPIPINYNVTVAPGIQHGTITPNLTSLPAGSVVTLTISPDEGYRLDTISVKQGGTAVALSGSGNTRTFTMPPSHVTVSAAFIQIPNGTLMVLFDGFGDEVINLTTNANYNFHRYSDESLTVTVNGAYDSYYWYVDGERIWWRDTNTYTYNEYDGSGGTGIHTITVVVKKDDVPYSKELTFKVVW